MHCSMPRRLAALATSSCMQRLQFRKLHVTPYVLCARIRRSDVHRTNLHICCAQKSSALPGSLQKIVGAFQMVPDPMARYKQLLYFATKLAPLPAEDHNASNKVEGCVSQVWVVPEMRDDGRVYWKADSDSALTKGLAALLVQGLSGCTPEEILAIEPDFIEMLGLKQALTPSRNNGFLNMFLLMKKKTLTLYATKQAVEGAAAQQAAAEATPEPSPAPRTPAVAGAGMSGRHAPLVLAANVSATPIQDAMRNKISESLQPIKLNILDESAQHAGHAAMRAVAGKAGGGGGETHFKVEVVSAAFEGLNLVKRHRMIYGLLADEFAQGLHALTLDTKAPSEVK